MKGYIIEMLEKYKNLGRISFSMPGHKNKKTADIFKDAADVTELADTDSLYNPCGAVKKACEKIAGIAGSDESFIMVNGSTGGIFAMIASVCKRGDTLLASRACHMSVINACVVLGVNLIFFEHKIYSKYSIHGEADISDISRKISENAVKAVLITSPNYFGAVSDICSIVDLLKGTDIPLLVDEAHGGHFFAGGVFPESAVCLGADMVVESMHKTPAGLNQSAVLHVKSGRIDLERVRDMLAVFQTSSPSYLIAASAESAFYETVHGGWDKTAERCGKLKKVLLKKTKIKVPCIKDGFFALDPARLVFNFSEYDITGYKVSDILRKKYNIDIEMADSENIVLIATPNNDDSDFEALENALLEICAECRGVFSEKKLMNIPGAADFVISPSEAFYSFSEYLPLEESVGKICAKTVLVYPPAIPVLAPGQRISRESVEYLKNCGGEIIGLEKGAVKIVREGRKLE